MTFDARDFIPTQNDWFSIHIELEGQGRAKFLDPDAVVEGPTQIQFDEFGESKIELVIETVKSKQPLEMGLMQLFSGNKVVDTGKGKLLTFGGARNPCIELEVSTPDGVLLAHEHIDYSFQIGSSESKLSFSVLSPQFDVNEPSEPKYWVIPLSNFISDFRRNYPSLDNHPLRIFPTSAVPEDLPEEDKVIATLTANQKNRLITFKFNESPGFIEPLPDFDDRKSSLLSRQALNRVTSVMVGEVGSNSIESTDLKHWFPFDFLLLLGIANGTEVGAPWIEFRDAEGKLVRRIHSSLGHPLFSKGHAAIKEGLHSGTGYLLTRAQSSPKYSQSFLRVAMKNIVRGGLYSPSIEDKLRHLFLVFDNLAEEYGIRRTLSLKKKNERLVDAVVKGANKVINEIARQVQENGDPSEAKILTRIAQQISGAKIVHTGFGQNVIDLMRKFDLPDSDIVSQYYEKNPRPDRRKWVDVMSYYRGIVMHRSYFDFQEGEFDIDDVLRIFKHLHDILVRITFKILGYDGTYQPTVTSMETDQPIDWVKPDTPASHLGY